MKLTAAHILPGLFLLSVGPLSAQNTSPFPSSGNVGIGTTSPGVPLDVNGPIRSFSGSIDVRLQAGATGAAGIGSFSNDPVLLITAGTEKARLTTSGDLGVGTTSPYSAANFTTIDVRGATGGDISFGTNSTQTGILYSYANATVLGSVNTAPLVFNSAGIERVRIDALGNVGIGTSTASAKFQVGSWNRFRDGTWAPPLTPNSVSAGERIVFYEGGGWKTAIGMDGQNGIWFQVHTPAGQVAYQWFTGTNASAPSEMMRIMDSGNVGIGTTTPTHKLAVNGTIRAKEVIVDTGWSDYVFADDYRLAPLAEVESHIKAERHLPGIPSAQEVAEHGVSMGEMQSKLLAKIEELTLHQIAQEKIQAAQEKRLNEQSTRLQRLEQENATLRNTR